MITPVKTYSFPFTSDGTSTTLIYDLSLLPIADEFKGSNPVGVVLPTVTSTFTGALTGVTATVSGSTVTFTFISAPAKLDNNSNLIVYTATCVVQFAT